MPQLGHAGRAGRLRFAVVDSAERVDEDMRKVREASRLLVESYAAALLERRPATIDLVGVCGRLGLDVARVRERARWYACASTRPKPARRAWCGRSWGQDS